MQLDQNGLYDIYGVVSLPFWQQRWFINTLYISVGTLAILLLIIGIYYLIGWYKKRSVPIIVQVIAHITLLHKQTQNASDIEYITIYAQVLASLRRYYAHARGHHWLSATEQELMLFVTDHSADTVWHQPLKDFLERSHSAKYAHQVPHRTIILQDIQMILTYLNTCANQDNKQ